VARLASTGGAVAVGALPALSWAAANSSLKLRGCEASRSSPNVIGTSIAAPCRCPQRCRRWSLSRRPLPHRLWSALTCPTAPRSWAAWSALRPGWLPAVDRARLSPRTGTRTGCGARLREVVSGNTHLGRCSGCDRLGFRSAALGSGPGQGLPGGHRDPSQVVELGMHLLGGIGLGSAYVVVEGLRRGYGLCGTGRTAPGRRRAVPACGGRSAGPTTSIYRLAVDVAPPTRATER